MTGAQVGVERSEVCTGGLARVVAAAVLDYDVRVSSGQFGETGVYVNVPAQEESNVGDIQKPARLGHRWWECLNECPFPTLAYASRDQHAVVHGQHYAMRLCAVRGIRCAGRNRTD